MNVDLLAVKPFEICTVRPPTENYGLSFRLTRNCYWNRCKFCRAYKFGAGFSRRSLDEVKKDVQRAKLIDNLLECEGVGLGTDFTETVFTRAGELVGKIKRLQQEAGIVEELEKEREVPDNLAPGAAWYLSWYKDTFTLEDCVNHVLSWRLGRGETCFMGDADSLVLKPDFMAGAIDCIRTHFPSIRRFTVYGRTKTAAKVRSLDDLKAFRAAGLNRVHYGLESGADTVLDFIKKGVTKEEHIEGGLKTNEAGLSCSVYVMPGLGGTVWSEDHAHETADVITKISPDYVRLRSLQVFSYTPLGEAMRKEEFTEANEEQVVREIRTMVEEIDTEAEVISDSAANLLNVNGKLPEDRNTMLREIDDYLALSKREKLMFSLQSRLESFMGQYCGITKEIYDVLRPFIANEKLDVMLMSDEQMGDVIALVRSRLVP